MSELFVSLVILSSGGYTDTIALDIGAACGQYSKELSSFFRDVYAFEADEAKIPDLKSATKHYPNIHVINKAVSDTTEVKKLYISSLDPGRHTINEKHVKERGASWGYDETRFNTIETVTIDDLCRDENVGFIKCDIEGAEEFIFKSAVETIKKNKMDVVIELHEGVNLQPLQDLFTSFGYKTFASTNYALPDDGMIHYLFSNKRTFLDINHSEQNQHLQVHTDTNNTEARLKPTITVDDPYSKILDRLNAIDDRLEKIEKLMIG